MAYYRHIELKGKEIKLTDFEQYLEDVNNKYFSGLLNVTKFKDKHYIIEYNDDYFVSIDINDDKEVDERTIDFRFTLKFRMNEILTQIFTQYIAEKIADYDDFKMEYEKILYDEIEGDYVNIYEPESIDNYINYIIYDIGYVEDDIKKFAKKIKRNKIINKIKMFFFLY